MNTKIAVIGAGVIGTACAVQIAEYFPDTVDVTLLTDHVSPQTTGDGSAGFWTPYLCGDTSAEKIIKWGKITHDLFRDLWKNGLAQETGISLIPVLRFGNTEDFEKCIFWKDVPYGFTILDQEQLKRFNKDYSSNYTTGFQYITFTCQPTFWLPYLYKRFITAGGQMKRQRVSSFEDIADDFDLIINASGLYSRILANDSSLMSIRGQVMRINAPWQFHVFFDESGNYIIPNVKTVVLGGTHQENDYSVEVDENDSKTIYHGCTSRLPALTNAVVCNEWVGLRPGRYSIRIEEETIQTRTKKVKIIHNYGHGGCGLTLSWGCALDVLDMVKLSISNNSVLVN